MHIHVTAETNKINTRTCTSECSANVYMYMRPRPLLAHHSSWSSLSLVPRYLKKLEGDTHCLRMCGSPSFSGELGNFRKIYSVTLTSVCQLISPVWKMPGIDHALSKRWRGSDENMQLFACKNYLPVCPFQVNTVAREWCNLSLWSRCCQSDSIFDFKTLRMYFTESIRNSAVWFINR